MRVPAFRNEGELLLYLDNSNGIDTRIQRSAFDAVYDLNCLKQAPVDDPELASRLIAYELAYRMQSAGPDLSGESKTTLETYGFNRTKPKIWTNVWESETSFRAHATACSLDA